MSGPRSEHWIHINKHLLAVYHGPVFGTRNKKWSRLGPTLYGLQPGKEGTVSLELDSSSFAVSFVLREILRKLDLTCNVFLLPKLLHVDLSFHVRCPSRQLVSYILWLAHEQRHQRHYRGTRCPWFQWEDQLDTKTKLLTLYICSNTYVYISIHDIGICILKCSYIYIYIHVCMYKHFFS